jgi:hypothetical protein
LFFIFPFNFFSSFFIFFFISSFFYLFFLSSSFFPFTDKNRETQQKTTEADQEVITRDMEMRTLEQRIASLINETSVEGKARVRAETTAEVMSDQLDALRRENSLMHAAVSKIQKRKRACIAYMESTVVIVIVIFMT